MADKIHELLNFWFGNLGLADLPSSDRTSLWFGDNDAEKQKLIQLFEKEFQDATMGRLDDWSTTPRGRLALIILFDQFPRHMYRHSPQAFAYDEHARQLCIEGLRQKMDKSLTLVERVFFYMPLVHTEDTVLQEQSIRLYQDLASLSMNETVQVYQLFLAYAYAHFRVIKQFGRFPQRNRLLGRESTPAELEFLKSA